MTLLSSFHILKFMTYKVVWWHFSWVTAAVLHSGVGINIWLWSYRTHHHHDAPYPTQLSPLFQFITSYLSKQAHRTIFWRFKGQHSGATYKGLSSFILLFLRHLALCFKGGCTGPFSERDLDLPAGRWEQHSLCSLECWSKRVSIYLWSRPVEITPLSIAFTA